MSEKPLPIGVEDFKELVDGGYFFADKTLMIKDFFEWFFVIHYPRNEN